MIPNKYIYRIHITTYLDKHEDNLNKLRIVVDVVKPNEEIITTKDGKLKIIPYSRLYFELYNNNRHYLSEKWSSAGLYNKIPFVKNNKRNFSKFINSWKEIRNIDGNTFLTVDFNKPLYIGRAIKNAINIIIRKYNAPWLISKWQQEACKQFIQNINEIINE